MASPPFDASAQLDDSSVLDTLPGFPNLRLQNAQVVLAFLEKELLVSELDELSRHLPAPPPDASTTISPLHYHRFKARDIVVIEDPGLHLTFIHDRLFLKPIPRYLLSHAFWTTYLHATQPSFAFGGNKQPAAAATTTTLVLRGAALGFLRTYAHLIRHESDLRLALSAGLLPDAVTWASWCAFVANLPTAISDADVCPRYRHAELSLPRLNWLAKLYLRRFRYRESHGRRGGNLRRFYEPLLFLFGVLSLVLSAMQVGLGALPPADLAAAESWRGFVRTCRWMAVVSLLLMALLLLSLPLQDALVALTKAAGVLSRLLQAPLLGASKVANPPSQQKMNV